MKTWEKYKDLLLTGEWHIHTRYSDGMNSVDDYCKRAIELGIPLLAFTEHVRTELTYEFNELLSDIDSAREKYDLHILSGCEVKVLPSGMLDADPSILNEVDYPIFAFHSFPNDMDTYIKALKIVIKNPYLNTWCHPGLFLKKNNNILKPEALRDILNLLNENEILLEINKRYALPPKKWLNDIQDIDVQSVRGSDVHSLADLKI